MHKLILASGAGPSLVVTITIIVDTSAQVTPLPSPGTAMDAAPLYLRTKQPRRRSPVR